MKSIQIRIFFWSVFSRIRTEYGEITGKYGPEKTTYFNTFHAVLVTSGYFSLLLVPCFSNSVHRNSQEYVTNLQENTHAEVLHLQYFIKGVLIPYTGYAHVVSQVNDSTLKRLLLPVGKYLFMVNNKALEEHAYVCCSVFVNSFEQLFPIVLRPIVADTQETFTCSKSTIKTVEKGLKHILC